MFNCRSRLRRWRALIISLTNAGGVTILERGGRYIRNGTLPGFCSYVGSRGRMIQESPRCWRWLPPRCGRLHIRMEIDNRWLNVHHKDACIVHQEHQSTVMSLGGEKDTVWQLMRLSMSSLTPKQGRIWHSSCFMNSRHGNCEAVHPVSSISVSITSPGLWNMLNVLRTLGFGRWRDVNLLKQRGESFSEAEEGLASMEWEEVCNARIAGSFLTEMEGGGDATANNSSRLASVELTFSLSSMSISLPVCPLLTLYEHKTKCHIPEIGISSTFWISGWSWMNLTEQARWKQSSQKENKRKKPWIDW